MPGQPSTRAERPQGAEHAERAPAGWVSRPAASDAIEEEA